MGGRASTTRYLFPDGLVARAALADLGSRFDIRVAAPRRVRTRYLDTFDWRIHAQGWELAYQGDEFRLSDVQDATLVDVCRGEGSERFWWDFPPGPFRDRLRGWLQERSLLPLFELTMTVRPVTVVNEDEKTVVRARLEDAVVFDGVERRQRLVMFVLNPVRGYDHEFARVGRRLSKMGLAPAAAAIAATALPLVGRTPGDYSSKLDVSLSSDMPAREAAVTIFRLLLDTMRRNEPGIVADIDTEFVHDFRVAVRRTRAGLTQLKDVLPGDVTAGFKDDFARVGRVTNRLRDLDVYLLERDRYRAMLPDDLRDGLGEVFASMEAERITELEGVCAALKGGDYLGVIRRWDEALASAATLGPSANADISVAVLARRFIYKRFRRVIRGGTAITPTSPDADLHALRIDCKKLRYLLEFFSSLFPDDVKGLVRQLKKLQDNLGGFNDYSVQQEELRKYMAEQTQARPTAAIGALVGCLFNRQREARREFASRFDAFASDENRSAFRRLFAPEKP